jgi:hypothetical protein
MPLMMYMDRTSNAPFGPHRACGEGITRERRLANSMAADQDGAKSQGAALDIHAEPARAVTSIRLRIDCKYSFNCAPLATAHIDAMNGGELSRRCFCVGLDADSEEIATVG